jgi:phage shock protein E
MRTGQYLMLFLVAIFGLVACSSMVTNQTKESVSESRDTKTIIVDVRTVQEWNQDGHANCSVNYPLDILSSKIELLKPYNKIVLVCRSGNRANTAKRILEQAGLQNIENKGAWQNITCKN